MSTQSRDDKRIQSTPIEVLRDVFNIGKVKRVFRLGTELVNAAAPFLEKRTPLSALHAALSIGKVIVDDMEIWPDEFFSDDWECPYPRDFNKTVHRALVNKPYKMIRTSNESFVIYMVTLEDVQVGYIINTKSNIIDKIYVEPGKVARAKELIKAELWKILKDDNIVLRHSRRAGDYDNSNVVLDVDDAFRPMPSRRSEEYSVYLKKCIDAGVPRSVLLYGPPGTGKSTMARTIVDNLGMKSFRIRVEDIEHLETSSVFEAISIFEPDAIILDDFDRSSTQAQLLETLEFFQRHVKLVIATVNNKNCLDEAILRPGRFDELLQVKQMDGDVVKVVLGDEHAAAYDLVKDWPIAFIQEYVKRRRFMNTEEAAASVVELAARVKRLAKYDDDEEVTVVETSSKNVGTPWDDFVKDIKKKRRKKKVVSL